MNQATKSFAWIVSVLAVVGCRSNDRFDTRNGETYCGVLVGQGTLSTGFEEPGWEGISGAPTLSLTLNTGEFYKKGGVPAVMTSNDATFGPCRTSHALFEQAKVRTLGAALGDRLSSMRLNDDHEEDLVTYVDSTCSGSMVGILSLIKNGDVEMRLLRPAPYASDNDPSVASTDRERFGLFVLSKTNDGCSF